MVRRPDGARRARRLPRGARPRRRSPSACPCRASTSSPARATIAASWRVRSTAARSTVGDAVVFYPSGKRSRVKTIEGFSRDTDRRPPSWTQPTGFTLEEQIYVTRGEIAAKEGEPGPEVSTRLRVSLFWLGRQAMVPNKEYLLKLGTLKVPMRLEKVERVLDASTLGEETERTEIQRHDVADCILKLRRPLAFDLTDHLARTSRFVVVDDYDIRGGGIVREALSDTQSDVREKVFLRNYRWEKSFVNREDRAERYSQKSSLRPDHGPQGGAPQGGRQGPGAAPLRGRQVRLLPRLRQRALRPRRRREAETSVEPPTWSSCAAWARWPTSCWMPASS